MFQLERYGSSYCVFTLVLRFSILHLKLPNRTVLFSYENKEVVFLHVAGGDSYRAPAVTEKVLLEAIY